MPTKYELMTELRVLSRGLKPLAISRMNKGELLASIELTKKMIQEKGLIPEIKGKRDRYLPRPIESEEKKIDGVVLNIPLKPRAIVKCKKDIESAKLVPATTTYVASLLEVVKPIFN
jgi:hypothetical protein